MSRIARQLMRTFLKVGSMDVGAQALALGLTVLKYRYFKAETMGVLAYYAAMADIPSAFYADLNRVISRFAPGAAERRKAEILLVAGSLQLLLLGLFLAAVGAIMAWFPSLRFWNPRAMVGDEDIAFALLFALGTVPLTLMRSILTAMAASLGKYVAIQWLNLAVIAANGCILAGVMASGLGMAGALKALLMGQWCLAWMPLAVLVVGLGRWSRIPAELVRIRLAEWPGVFRSVYREHIRDYTLPMQLASIMAYVKENLAVLFMGQAGLMSEAGIYGVANRLYGIPRKFVPNLVSFMMPKLVSAVERDPIEFRRKYDVFSWMQFWVHMGMGTALFVFFPVIREVFALPDDRGLPFVFFLFSLNLTINSIAHMNHNIILLGKNTWWQLFSSAMRMVVVTLLTVLLVPAYGSLGAAVALVASTLAITFTLAWDTRNTQLWTWSTNVYQIACCLLVAILWGAMFKIFGNAYPLPW